jgi:hypothetical protein
MTKLEEILGQASSDLLNPDYVVAVARHKGKIHWILIDRENLVLDLKKWRDAFVKAGYAVPELSAASAQRSGITVVDRETAKKFLESAEVHRLDIEFLRKALLERFPDATSWWDVGFLFPIAFIDFDNQRFAGFYQGGPPLERYVPDGWIGEFTDFANTYPDEIFPKEDKFWIVGNRDLLHELNERGHALEASREKK